MTKQLIAGVLIGVIVPLLGIFIIPTLLRPDLFTFQVIKDHFWLNKSMMPTIQLSLIPNLGVFFLLNRIDKEVMSRGVIAGTLFWGVYLIVIGFVI